jgi:hypothetical protein
LEVQTAKIYPEADRQKGTVKIEVKLSDPDLRIVKPEMSAKVIFLAKDIHTQAAPLVIAPKRAIVTDGPERTVWVVRDGIAHRIAIGTGREFQDGVEVRSGLNGGELVIVEPPDGSQKRLTGHNHELVNTNHQRLSSQSRSGR